MTTAIRSTAGRGARRAVRHHLDLLFNSGSLMATAVVTSTLGFGYWWVAARAFSPEAVGSASAAISATMVIGTIGMVGMGTLLISELRRLPAARQWNLISAGLLVAGCAAAVGALGYVTLAHLVMTAQLGVLGSHMWAAVFVAGTAATAMALVLDEALVGLLAGRWQLIRNTFFASGKLLIIGVLALLPVGVTGGEVLSTWVAGILVSMLLLAACLRRRGRLPWVYPDLSMLRGLRRRALDHNLLNLALYLPRTALPLVVTVVLSTRATAGFYIAWMIFSFVAMVPNTLATALFAVAATEADALRSNVRVALFLSLACGVPASGLLAFLARPAMALFGHEYAVTASGTLAILALTYVPMVFQQLFIAVVRVRGHVRVATVMAVVAGMAELGAAWYGGSRGDLTMLAVAFAVVVIVEGLVVAPVVLRVALAKPAPSLQHV
jgi:O-antigen/teichoic acid export membrane protein